MMQPHRGADLIFVGGSPRSGTTLLQNILDSHSNIAGGPEFDRVPDILKLRDALRQSVESKRIDVFLSAPDVDREVAHLIERLLLPYGRRQECTMISEKTPWNVLHFLDLLRILPDCRCIFVVRDPRAVVASMLEVGRRAKEKGVRPAHFTRSLWNAIHLVKRCNDAGFTAMDHYPDRVLLVRYEEVVNQPVSETKRICAFLGQPWEEAMLEPGQQSHDGQGAAVDGVWFDRKMYQSNPDPGRVDAWRSKLHPLQQAIVNDAFRDDVRLAEIGYRFDKASPSPVYACIGKTLAGLRRGKSGVAWKLGRVRTALLRYPLSGGRHG